MWSGGHGQLAHQTRGQEHGSPLRGERAEQGPDPEHGDRKPEALAPAERESADPLAGDAAEAGHPDGLVDEAPAEAVDGGAGGAAGSSARDRSATPGAAV